MGYKVLFVHPRRGMFQFTSCADCGYSFECQNCDAKLTTYKASSGGLELICHQCQSYYHYPKKCPKCQSENVFSSVGGVEELVERLNDQLQTKIFRFDKNKEVPKLINPKSIYEEFDGEISVTTRIFDPSINYEKFDKVVIVQAENLTASLDYLVVEETAKNLADLLGNLPANCEIILDTNVPGLDFFKEIIQINRFHPEAIDYKDWFLQVIEKEKKLRETFGFLPFNNLLLITSQEKKRQQAIDSVNKFKFDLQKYLEDLPELKISSPYPARILRRKNMYSYHLLIKYPRQYANFAKLRETITDLANVHKVQVRLNPRHLF